MEKPDNIDALYDEAVRMMASGHDNTYIELQFLEEGIQKDTIDAIVKRINSVRKAEKRQKGRKLMFYGASFVAAGILFSLLSAHADSPVQFILYGLCVSGVLIFAKGVVDMI